MTERMHAPGEVLQLLLEHTELHLDQAGRRRRLVKGEAAAGVKSTRFTLDIPPGMTAMASIAITHSTVSLCRVDFYRLREQYDHSYKVRCLECEVDL